MERKDSKVKKWLLEQNQIPIWLIILMDIGIIVTLCIAVPIETAKAEEPIGNYIINFGIINNIININEDYEVRIVTANIESKQVTQRYIIKRGNEYEYNGNIVPLSTLKNTLIGNIILEIYGDIKSLCNISKAINIIDSEWKRYDSKVINPQLRATTLSNTYLVKVGTAQYNESITITINTQYVGSFTTSKVVSNDTQYKNILKENKVIFEYNTDSNRIYQNGYEKGYAKATNTVNKSSASYIQGVQDGNNADYSFFGLMTAIVNAPIEAFNGMFNIEILGTNIRTFLLSLLTISLVILIIRKFVA